MRVERNGLEIVSVVHESIPEVRSLECVVDHSARTSQLTRCRTKGRILHENIVRLRRVVESNDKVRVVVVSAHAISTSSSQRRAKTDCLRMAIREGK